MKIPDIIIAVDGCSSTGKSTFAKMVAQAFGFLYLDSGAMYRGVTLYAMENGLIGPEGEIDEAALKAVIGEKLNGWMKAPLSAQQRRFKEEWNQVFGQPPQP